MNVCHLWAVLAVQQSSQLHTAQTSVLLGTENQCSVHWDQEFEECSWDVLDIRLIILALLAGFWYMRLLQQAIEIIGKDKTER